MSTQKVYVVDLSKPVTGAQLDAAVRALKRSAPDKVVFKRGDDTTGQNPFDEIAACGIATEVVGPDWQPAADHVQLALH